MQDLDKIRIQLANDINNDQFFPTGYYDIGDIGSVIGAAMGKLSKEDQQSFIDGIKHGLSLADGTHWRD